MLALGFDPIWFGVIIVLVVEMGVITPPVGINVYIIKGVAPRRAHGADLQGGLAVLGRHGHPGGAADDLPDTGYLAAELDFLLTSAATRVLRPGGGPWRRPPPVACREARLSAQGRLQSAPLGVVEYPRRCSAEQEDTVPLIVVKMLEGRSVEQKRRLVREMTSVVAKYTGAPEEQVDVIIEDYPKENWAKGGVLFYDKQG